MKSMLLASTIAALVVASPATAGDGKGKGKKSDGEHPGVPAHAVVVPGPVPVPVVVGGGHKGDGSYGGDASHKGDSKAKGRHDNGRHLGQRKQAWARGQNLPRTYLDQRYYVNDYGQYQLVAPPPGMVWVRPYEDERRFYLVRMATGVITQILGR